MRNDCPKRKDSKRRGKGAKTFSKTLAFLLAIFIAFHAIVPQALALMSISEERELGDKLLKQVLSQVRLIDDPEIEEFVQATGESILQVIPRKYFKYRFFVILDPALNAFAMPGGLVFVHSGLLEAIGSQNELACVLAHEFGHVQGRHVARRIDNMKYVSIGTAVMAIAGLFLGRGELGSAILTGSMAMNQAIALKYSRADEQEADRRAFQWLCEAGWDPRGLKTTLERMMKNNWLGSPHIPKYLSTHPVPEERLTYLEDLWKSHPCYLKHKEDPFRLKRIQTKIKVISNDPAELIARYEQLLKKKPKDVEALYGYALSLDKARRFDLAIKTYDKLISIYPEKKIFLRDKAITFFHMGRYRDAVSLLKKYVKDHPNDITTIYFLARSFLEGGAPKNALIYFKRLLPLWEDNAPFLFQLGRCYAGVRQDGLAHYYFYRFYYLTGKAQAASYHRKRAMMLLPKNSPVLKKLKMEKDEKAS